MSQLGELGFGSGTSGRASKPKRGRGCLAVLLSLVVIAGIGWVAWDRGRVALQELISVPDYSGTGKGKVAVQVEEGDTIGQIAQTLADQDVVKSAEAFERAASENSRALSIQPGHYRLKKEMSGKSALELILDPNARVLNRVTISEGKRLDDTLRTLAKKTGIDRGEFEAVVKNAQQQLPLPKAAKGKAEGFLFPATYNYDPSTTAQGMLEKMVGRFGRASDKVSLKTAAEETGYTPREIVTVASLIQAEARHQKDFAKVARVIYNRLDEGMLLQLDSTTNYVTGSDTVTTTPEERRTRDPYNTYWAEGLPPGPINSPGMAALKAALHPADGDWLYFVTVNLDTGETKFAESYSQHQQYTEEFQQWCQNNKGEC